MWSSAASASDECPSIFSTSTTKSSRSTGVDTVKYDPRASADILDELRVGFETSALVPSTLLTFLL